MLQTLYILKVTVSYLIHTHTQNVDSHSVGQIVQR